VYRHLHSRYTFDDNWIVFSAIIIQGAGPIGLAANAARDVGGRFAAITIWGSRAAGGTYALLAALTSIPATMAAMVFYELIFKDSSRGKQSLLHISSKFLHNIGSHCSRTPRVHGRTPSSYGTSGGRPAL
jgi:hypothetical protein